MAVRRNRPWGFVDAVLEGFGAARAVLSHMGERDQRPLRPGSINDAWRPVGNGNPMNILDNGNHLAQTMSFDELGRCLDLSTNNGAKTMNLEDRYGIEEGKPPNLLVLDARTPFEAVRQRADALASIRNGEYLFRRPEPSYDVALDLFRTSR